MNTLQLSTKLGKISELKAVLSNKEKSNESLVQLFEKFSTTKILAPLESIKSKGITTKNILLGLLLTRLLSLTVRSLVLSGQYKELHKDTYYRLKNNESIDWRKFIYLIIYRYFQLIKKHSNFQGQGIKCLIIDDSFLEKTGKLIEFIGKVFDHITKRTMLGFRILILGYWDGVAMNPIDFSLHREKGKNKSKPYGLKNKELALRFDKKREKTTAGSKRVKELDVDKISNAIKMIKRAVKHGIIVHYVLMDSWFVTEKMIKSVRALKQGKIHLVGMSKMDKRKYNYNGKDYTASELIKKNIKKELRKSRTMKTHYIRLVVDYKGVKLQLFFTKNSKSSNWKLLVTTDLSLKYVDTVKLYQLRWTIEVFFKEAKQYLQLGQSQSNDFDAQIADASISIMVYMLLNFKRRFDDYESLGDLFRQENQQLRELTLWDKLWGLFFEIINTLFELFDIEIDEVIQKIIAEHPDNQKLWAIIDLLKQQHDKAA